MKIAVTGPRGRLGSELVRQGCIPLDVDVTDAKALHQGIAETNPDVIIHTAAITNVDACEHSPIPAAKVNTGSVHLLSQIFTGKIVYISTDYVFDGKNGPYRETDAPNPIGIYGWSKLGGELVLRGSGHLVIRTTVLFDKDNYNFVTAVIERLLALKEVSAPNELYGSPTYIPHLAEGILAAIDKGLTGILNIAGNRVMSRFELAGQIVIKMGIGRVAQGVAVGAANRPLKAGLITEKAQRLGIPIYDPLVGVDEIIKERVNNGVETVAAG